MGSTTGNTKDLIVATFFSVGMFFVNLIGGAFLGGAYHGVHNILSALTIFLPFIILNLICFLLSFILGNKNHTWGFVLGYIAAFIYFALFFILPILI